MSSYIYDVTGWRHAITWRNRMTSYDVTSRCHMTPQDDAILWITFSFLWPAVMSWCHMTSHDDVMTSYDVTPWRYAVIWYLYQTIEHVLMVCVCRSIMAKGASTLRRFHFKCNWCIWCNYDIETGQKTNCIILNSQVYLFMLLCV